MQTYAGGAEEFGRVKALLQTLSGVKVVRLDLDPVHHDHQLADQQPGHPVHGEAGHGAWSQIWNFLNIIIWVYWIASRYNTIVMILMGLYP